MLPVIDKWVQQIFIHFKALILLTNHYIQACSVLPKQGIISRVSNMFRAKGHNSILQEKQKTVFVPFQQNLCIQKYEVF